MLDVIFPYNFNADSFKLVNAAPGLVLDVSGADFSSGTNVLGWADNGELNQRWTFNRIG